MINYSKRTDPSKGLDDKEFRYVSALDTNLAESWKTFFQSIREEDPDSIQRSAVANGDPDWVREEL